MKSISYEKQVSSERLFRVLTGCKLNFPVLIKGYRRSWSVHPNLPGLNTTFLSIIKDKHASFNGVVYKLSKPENIQLYDKRETAYCRAALIVDRLKMYSGTLPDKKQMWIYSASQKSNEYPTHELRWWRMMS